MQAFMCHPKRSQPPNPGVAPLPAFTGVALLSLSTHPSTHRSWAGNTKPSQCPCPHHPMSRLSSIPYAR